jgi:hypothetical protein
MPYIGNPIYQSAFVVDQFSGNGSTTAFTMSVAPAGVTNVLVSISGVLQDPSTYGVVGNTITFSAAPPTGTGNISCRYLGVPVTGVTTTAYRTVTEFTATASQTTFTPPSYTVGFINVYLNGVLLGSADYTATNGTTVVLATGAAAGNLVTVESFLVSSVLNAIPNTAGSVSSSNIVDGAITTAKIVDANVTTAKIASSVSLTTPTLVTPTVTNNLTFSTSNAGIVFNKASALVNSTLNDYEDGTFTATLTGASAAPSTPITTTGAYIKVGKHVTVTFGFSNVDTTGASGSTLVTGMPFSAHGSIPTVSGVPMLYSLPVPQSYNVWYITGTVLNLYAVGNGTGWSPVSISAGTGKYVWSTFTYITAT